MNIVCIAFVTAPPEGIPRTTVRRSFCRFAAMARQGDAFYTEAEDVSCPLARFHLGLQKRVPALYGAMAGNVARWYRVEDDAFARSYLEHAPNLPDDDGKDIVVFGAAPDRVPPDLAVVSGRPDEIMELVRGYVIASGGKRLQAQVGGIAATCCEAGSIPLVTGRPNISLGCCGTRSAGELPPEEMLLGIPRACFGSFNLTAGFA